MKVGRIFETRNLQISVEKRRRDKITETIMQLGDYLPEEEGDEGSAAMHTKVSSWAVGDDGLLVEQGLHPRQGARLHREHGRRESTAETAAERRGI